MWIIYECLLTAVFLFFLPYMIFRAVISPREWLERAGIYAGKENYTGKGAVWVHASSIGETRAALTLVKHLKKELPGRDILLSTVTRNGNAVAKKSASGVKVIFVPLDLKLFVKNALRKFKPAVLVLMETEIWPNLIRECSAAGVPVMIACGRISKRSFKRYRALKGFFRSVLEGVKVFSMQTGCDAGRIIELGAVPGRVSVTGSLKYDLANDAGSLFKSRKEIKEVLGFPEDSRVIVAGSTRKGEEELVISAYLEAKAEFPSLCLLIAPRHVSRIREIELLLRKSRLNYHKRTEDGGKIPAGRQVLLLDTVGELLSLYPAADIVFVGGSIVPVGGHNLLEPALAGASVVFGPHMDNFMEISELFTKAGAAIKVDGGKELSAAFLCLLKDPGLRESMGKRAGEVIKENAGSVNKNVELLKGML